MGMDAKAYLWFGTKTRHRHEYGANKGEEVILPIPDVDGDWGEELEAFGKKLEADDIKLIEICSEGDDLYALGILASYKHHDWDFDSEKFEMYQPTEEDKGKLFAYATAMGWPVDLDEIGWHLGSTFY